MKITFVYPRFEKFLRNNKDIDRGLVDYYLGDFTTPPSLGIPIMASWTPDDIDIELMDDNSGDIIDYSAPTDLVAINCFTPQATRAFAIADEYRRHGKQVIMGGFFPSFMADECLKHCDSVNIGEVETTWLTIIEDAKKRQLKPKYFGGSNFDITKMKIPRRDIFYSKKSYTWEEDLIQLTRGCSYECAMCAIPNHMGHRIRFRPIEHVVEELKTLKYENVYLADDTLFFPQKKMVDYATELFHAIEPLKKKYFVASTMALKCDPDFMKLAAKAGVCNFYCTMNVDPVSIAAIKGDKAAIQQLVDLNHLLEDCNIRFFGSFAIGREWDDTSIADRVIELYQKSGIRTSEFFLFTPYPGSKQWDRLDRQNRIFDKNWSHYNGAHVVAEHPTMSRDELYGQFVKVWNDFFKIQKDRNAVDLEPLTYEKGREVVGIPLRQAGVRRQAVVTGMAAASPIGNDLTTITKNLFEGTTGLAPVSSVDASSFRTNIHGEIKGFDADSFLSENEKSAIDDPYLKRAIAMARRALDDAGIKLEAGKLHRNIAIVLGTCNGGLKSAENEYAWKHGKAEAPFDERMNLQAQYYGYGKAIAAALGIGGEVWLTTTACSSTTGAIGLAQMLVNKGYYQMVLVGGSDTLCVANMSGFNGLKGISTEQTAPFSEPVGLNVGEATVFWVVEEMEKAMLRRARIHAKLAGYATTSDAYHPTTPDPRGDGVYRTLTKALEDAGLPITDIGVVNAHGTGTDANDRAESKGIAKFIGDNPIPAVSLKAFFGHCMGSAGILEATCNILAMNEGFIPPTINFKEPRPGCTLDYVPNTARQKTYPAFISANYAFGGNNAAVVITDWDHLIPGKQIKNRRVAITGTGTVNSLGLGTAATLAALREKRRGLSSSEKLGLDGMRSKLGGFVQSFKGSEVDRRIDIDNLNPISRFATAAASLALQNAGVKVTPRTGDDAGIAMGICNGSNEMGHMDAVFGSDTYACDVSSFSDIVANATAGWVSNQLGLKGVNTTLSPGHHAGLQALAYAFEMIAEERAQVMLAGAADEVYAQTYSNYDLMEFLYQGESEENYRMQPDVLRRKVLGEGAAFLALESFDSAKERGATILAEMLSYGQSMDGAPFNEQSLDPAGLMHAIDVALTRAEIKAESIDAIVWAPQGNIQDHKVIAACTRTLGARFEKVPMLTASFNTGYLESASILVAAAVSLQAFNEGSLWPQMTGIPDLDNRDQSAEIKTVLVLGSSDVGYNFAALLKNGKSL